MAVTPQLYIAGLPIFTQGVHLDSLSHQVGYLTPKSTRRALDGTLWVQAAVDWKKKLVTISGQGLPTAGFSQHLFAQASYVTPEFTVAGIITAITGPDRDVWGAADTWSIVLEET